jgi:prevent-host-death family protein
MKTVTARDANQDFSRLLNEAAEGENIVITRRGRPVAILSPYAAAARELGREAAVAQILELMRTGVSLGGRRFTRDEMHER